MDRCLDNSLVEYKDGQVAVKITYTLGTALALIPDFALGGYVLKFKTTAN